MSHNNLMCIMLSCRGPRHKISESPQIVCHYPKVGFRNVRVAPSSASQCGTGSSWDKETGRYKPQSGTWPIFCTVLQKPAAYDLGSFLMIYPMKILIFSTKNLVIFCTIFLLVHTICYYKVRVSTGGVETRWLGWQFLHFL
jgi:hypothetical protein